MSTQMLYGGDETGALMFDLGSQSIRIGCAQDDTPKIVLPTMVGISDNDIPDPRLLNSKVEGEEKNTCELYENKKYHVDTTSLCVPRKGQEVINCMDDGMIENWELFEKIIDYSYSKCLRLDSQSYPVLFSESPLNTRRKREQLVELMFEKFKVPAIYLAKNAVLAAFSCGRSTALVLDSGATHTTVTPVNDGYVIPSSIIKSHLGGNLIATECMKYFSSKEIEVIPHYMVAQKQRVNEKERPIWTPKRLIPDIRPSWHSYMCKLVVQDFKHSVLEVSESPYNEILVSNFPTSHYEFPNGYNQEFGKERFKIPEVLFNPNMNGNSSILSLSNIITASVSMCDADLQPLLYNSIVVTGGNTLLKGFTKRLTRDVTDRLSDNIKLKFIIPKETTERRFGSWIGGSIMASLGTFQQMWFSRQDYFEGGKSLVHKKCS